MTKWEEFCEKYSLLLGLAILFFVAFGIPWIWDSVKSYDSSTIDSLIQKAEEPRIPPPAEEDDPSTTNDESNDQPVGYYGDMTANACSDSSGNCYNLDIEMSGGEPSTIYFPKGGNVDMDYCDDEYTCTDEDGNEWTFEY